jgi:hypothetical protein
VEVIAMSPEVLVAGVNGYMDSHFCRYVSERDVPALGVHNPPEVEL